MVNLPRIFRRAAPPPAPAPAAIPPAPPVESPPTLPMTDPNAISIQASTSDEVAELDRLYQEALDAMEAVETELNRTNALLNIAPDTEQTNIDDPSAPTENEKPSAAQAPAAINIESGPVAGGGVRVTPRQIIEAALFVGGSPLTIKRLCTLLKGEFDQDFVEAAVENLNEQYSTEGRPYEIRFGTGGYRMELREPFEPVRNRVYGIGPREVKLGQDALEILSLVAYRQPIGKDDIDGLSGVNAANVLRQLLQRELIALKREGENGQDVTYSTTPRFLEVFGLADLNELPQAEELSFK